MKSIIIALTVILNVHTFSCSEDGKSGFMPENDMQIGVHDKVRSNMTEAEFNNIIDDVEAVYKPIIKKKRGWLRFSRKWEDKTVNASARRIGPLYLVSMYGGLARHPAVTNDAFALVVCHEVGHHLAGAPKNMIPMRWSSNEGQSDYFATLKCFRKVYGSDDNIQITSEMDIDIEVEEKCSTSWSNAADIALCKRASMAGKSLAKLLGGSAANPDFNTPDMSEARITNNSHPAGQCRLDTYFQGALCDVSTSVELSKKDPNVGTCNRVAKDILGIRPLCWYKPKKR